jgi:hypothetical protein
VLGEQPGERGADNPGGEADDADAFEKTLARRRRSRRACAEPTRRTRPRGTDLCLVLGQKRRAALNPPRTFGKMIGVARKLMAAEMYMIDRRQVISMLGLFISRRN